eukprot:UN00342
MKEHFKMCWSSKHILMFSECRIYASARSMKILIVLYFIPVLITPPYETCYAIFSLTSSL